MENGIEIFQKGSTSVAAQRLTMVETGNPSSVHRCRRDFRKYHSGIFDVKFK